MVLYKNMQPKYIESFWSLGSVRVSSLSYFANMHGDVRQDLLEGKIDRSYEPKEVIKVQGEHLPLADNIKILGGPVIMEPGANVNISGLSADALVFSVSEIQISKFGGGSYRIVDMNGFGKQLASGLKVLAGVPVVFSTVRKVEYGSYKDGPIVTQSDMDRTIREIQPGIRAEDYFLKPKRYEDEVEWRFIFVLDPSSSVPNVVTFNDLALTKFCEKCGS